MACSCNKKTVVSKVASQGKKPSSVKSVGVEKPPIVMQQQNVSRSSTQVDGMSSSRREIERKRREAILRKMGKAL